jgi:hypothetical protein
MMAGVFGAGLMIAGGTATAAEIRVLAGTGFKSVLKRWHSSAP